MFLWLLVALICLFAGGVQAVPLTAHAFRLPLTDPKNPDNGPSAEGLSPDGRWLAYIVTPKPGRLALALYDLPSAHAQTVSLGPQNPRFRWRGNVLVWRPDSRACVVGLQTGWAVVSPGRKRARWITRTYGYDGFDRAAWSPRNGRLAVFSGSGDFWVWDGTHVRRKANWLQETGIPLSEDERPWQCEWSPNGKSILLRFYGNTVRDDTDTGHLTFVNPGTGRFKWGMAAGPAHWLDNDRIAFRAEGDYIGGPMPVTLRVAQRTGGKERSWRAGVAAWALTARRDAVWIVAGEGDVWRTPLVKPRWRRMWHSEDARSRIPQADTVGLFLSPDGSRAALMTVSAITVSTIEIFHQGDPVRQWRPLDSDVEDIQVLGWAAGRTLPVLVVRHKDDTWEIWQLEQA